MEIYFLRHASAGQSKLPGKQDEKRPIDPKGEEQSREVGRLLAQLGVKPKVFLSSPLVRAVQTAHLVAEQIGFEDDIALDDALRPEASFEHFQELLKHYAKQKSIVVTGHNPNLSQFLSLMISNGSVDDAIYLKKAAVAKVDFKGHGQLNWCVTPKVVGAAYEAATSSSRPKTSRK